MESQGKWGYITEEGRFQIQPKYISAGGFSQGLAAVQEKQGGPYAVIDRSGTAVTEVRYEAVGAFVEGLAPVWTDSSCGFIDQTGRLVIPLAFEQVGSFAGGLARAKSGGKWGFIDHTGMFVIQSQYQGQEYDSPPVLGFTEGLAAVFTDGKSGYVDRTGILVIPAQFFAAGEFSEGLALVIVNVGNPGSTILKMGFIDGKGNMVIAPEFEPDSMTITNETISGFHNGLAAVRKYEQPGTGYIDETGQFVIQPIYDLAYSFYYGPVARVESKGEIMYIDRTGTVIYRDGTSPSAE